MAQDFNKPFTPSAPPHTDSVQEILAWALQEFEKLSIVIENLAGGQVAILTEAPKRPRDGMIRMADGTNWNPGGGGRGYYGFNSATNSWVKLG